MSNWNEEAAAEWAAHGVFHSRTAKEEWDAGGVWLLGDRWPDGYPGKTSGFCYKSWCSRPEKKYLPGNYPIKDRVQEDQWEFVQVLDGCLECVVQDEGRTKRFPLERSELVDIPPTLKRFWQFAEGEGTFASGIAFFRELGAPPVQPGAGEGYEFRLWDSGELSRLERPMNLSSWAVRFVEVLTTEGILHAKVRTLSGEAREYALSCRGHLFLRSDVAVTWQCRGNPSGIVVYL